MRKINVNGGYFIVYNDAGLYGVMVCVPGALFNHIENKSDKKNAMLASAYDKAERITSDDRQSGKITDPMTFLDERLEWQDNPLQLTLRRRWCQSDCCQYFSDIFVDSTWGARV